MDSVGLSMNLAMMVTGAILGVILAPLGQEFVGWLFKKSKKELGFPTVIFFLLVANGIWIIGEVMLTLIFASRDTAALFPSVGRALDLRDSPIGYSVSLITVVLVFLLASLALVASFQQLHKEQREDISFLETRKGPISLFIIGNLCWIIGEGIQVVLDAVFEIDKRTIVRELPWYWIGYIIRIVFSTISIGFFVAAAYRMWKMIPSEKSNGEA